MDLSASRIAYDSLAAVNAPSVALLAEWRRPSLFGRVNSGVTSFGGTEWSVQGSGSLAGWLAPLGILSPLRLELGVAAAGSHHSSAFESSLGRLDGRVHLLGRTTGAWLGTGLVRAKNSYDPAALGAVTVAAGAWIQSGWLRGTLSYEHTRLSGDSYPEGNVGLTLTRGLLDLSLYAGAREWPGDEGIGDELWAGAAAAFWVTANAALTVSGGKYPWDVLRGLPGGDFISIGIRLTPRRSRPIPITAPAPIVYSVEDAGRESIGFSVDDAESVEIAGDWTGWQTVPLARDASGRWVLPTTLGPGTYRFNLRIDGERWVVPDGFVTIDDGFGGVVGLLIVSEPDGGM